MQKLLSALFLRFFSLHSFSVSNGKDEEDLHNYHQFRFEWVTPHHFFTLHNVKLCFSFFILKLTKEFFRFTVFSSVQKANTGNGNSPHDELSLLFLTDFTVSLLEFSALLKCLGGWWKVHIEKGVLLENFSSFFTFLKLHRVFRRKYVFKTFFLLLPKRIYTRKFPFSLKERKTT